MICYRDNKELWSSIVENGARFAERKYPSVEANAILKEGGATATWEQ